MAAQSSPVSLPQMSASFTEAVAYLHEALVCLEQISETPGFPQEITVLRENLRLLLTPEKAALASTDSILTALKDLYGSKIMESSTMESAVALIEIVQWWTQLLQDRFASEGRTDDPVQLFLSSGQYLQLKFENALQVLRAVYVPESPSSYRRVSVKAPEELRHIYFLLEAMDDLDLLGYDPDSFEIDFEASMRLADEYSREAQVSGRDEEARSWQAVIAWWKHVEELGTCGSVGAESASSLSSGNDGVDSTKTAARVASVSVHGAEGVASDVDVGEECGSLYGDMLLKRGFVASSPAGLVPSPLMSNFCFGCS